MKNKGQKNERTTRVKSLILLVAFTAIMLIVSTYAWFSTQRAVSISNITGEVKVAEGLEISLDAQHWYQDVTLSSTTLTTVTTGDTVGTYYTGANHVPSELKPASTIGTAGQATMALYSGTFDGTALTDISACDETTAGTATTNTFAGYYAFDVFLRNSSSTSADQGLKLSSGSYAKILASGVTGSGNATSITTGDPTMGLQNTVRVAFAEYEGTAEVNASQSDILKATVGVLADGKTDEKDRARDVKTSQIAIWEPNSNYHVQVAVDNKARFDSRVTARDLPLSTYALNDKTTTTSITNVFDYATATISDRLTEQKTNKTTLVVPNDGAEPESYVTSEDISLNDTAATQQTFAIKGNAVSRLRVYVWIEGQDPDCSNYASHGGGIDVKIGLEKS